MKKLFLFLFILSSTVCHAQLSTGLKFNWTINKLTFKSDNENVEFIEGPVSDFGYLGLSGGIMTKYKLNHRISIQSELIFNPFRTSFAKMEYYTNWQDERWAVGNGFNISMNYLELPFMGKVSFGHKVTFDITAGAYVGYLLSAKQSTENGKLDLPRDTVYDYGDPPQSIVIDYPTQNVRKDYTSFNAGILAGLGVTMQDKIVFEFRISRGLIDINKDSSAKTYTLQGQFSVGWYIFRQKKKA